MITEALKFYWNLLWGVNSQASRAPFEVRALAMHLTGTTAAPVSEHTLPYARHSTYTPSEDRKGSEGTHHPCLSFSARAWTLPGLAWHSLGLPFADLPPKVPGHFSSLLPSIYFQTRWRWFSLPPVQLSRSLCLQGFMFTSSLFGLNFSNILCIFRLYLKAGPLLSHSHKGCVFSPKPPTAETGGRRQSSLVSSDVARNSQIADRGFRSWLFERIALARPRNKDAAHVWAQSLRNPSCFGKPTVSSRIRYSVVGIDCKFTTWTWAHEIKWLRTSKCFQSPTKATSTYKPQTCCECRDTGTGTG